MLFLSGFIFASEFAVMARRQNYLPGRQEASLQRGSKKSQDFWGCCGDEKLISPPLQWLTLFIGQY